MAGRRIVGKDLAQLLRYPRTCWMPGHVAMKYPPPVVCNDEETIENPKRQSWDGEEVHRRNHFSMVIQERGPSLRRLRVSRRLPHPALYGSLRDVGAEHLQLSMNAWRAPGRVLGHHAKDKLTQLLAYTSSTSSVAMTREPLPIQFESGSMPADDCLRLHEYQRLPPPRPEASQHHPEPLVSNRKTSPRTPPFQHSKLLPKSEIFQEQIAARMKGPRSHNEHEPQQGQHEVSLTRKSKRNRLRLI